MSRVRTEGSPLCRVGGILLRQLLQQLRPFAIWNLCVSWWIPTGHLFGVVPGEKGPHTCATRNERTKCHHEVPLCLAFTGGGGVASGHCCKSRQAAPSEVPFPPRPRPRVSPPADPGGSGAAGRNAWIYH